MRFRKPHRTIGACIVVLGMLDFGCTDRSGQAEIGPLPVAPTAYPTGPASVGPGVAEVSEDIQAVTIQIDDGEFGADVYHVQSRPTRLEVQAEGGPYTIEIDDLLEPRPLATDGAGLSTTVIGLTLPASGRYTMRLSGASTDTATLNVRPPGER